MECRIASLMISIVVQYIGNALLMISIVVKYNQLCIGIKLLMIKHSCAMHYN